MKKKIILILLVVIIIIFSYQKATAISICLAPFGGTIDGLIPPSVIATAMSENLAKALTTGVSTCPPPPPAATYAPLTPTTEALIISNLAAFGAPLYILLDPATDIPRLYLHKAPIVGNWVLGLYNSCLRFVCPDAGIPVAFPLVSNGPFLMMGTGLTP